uniref:Uncharacterized protein n=1 Tax=Macrostomum lignano TaxID=282301 RepID=A0A1I8FRW4_9PLAT
MSDRLAEDEAACAGCCGDSPSSLGGQWLATAAVTGTYRQPWTAG